LLKNDLASLILKKQGKIELEERSSLYTEGGTLLSRVPPFAVAKDQKNKLLKKANC